MNLRELARGKWDDIYRLIEPNLYALRGKRGHMPCPVHGGLHGDAFRWFTDGDGGAVCNTCGSFHDGLEVLRWYWGAGYKHVFDEVARALGVENKPSPERKEQYRQQNQAATQLFREARPGVSGAAYEYLRRRGASDSVLAMIERDAIWTHPNLRHPITKERRMALVMKLLNPQHKLAGAQAIFLNPDGSKYERAQAKVDVLKVLSLSASRCELFPANPSHIAVTEGLEDSLGIMQLTGIPCWAVMGTAGMRSFRLPDGVSSLSIYYDNDASFGGLAAASALAHKYAPRGVTVELIAPPHGCKDWGDALARGHL